MMFCAFLEYCYADARVYERLLGCCCSICLSRCWHFSILLYGCYADFNIFWRKL